MKLHITTMVVILIGCMMGNVYAQTPTRLQVAAVGEKEKAVSVANELDNMGFGPAEILSAGSLFKVLTRTYDSYAEANFAKQKIRALGFKDAFAIQEVSGNNSPIMGAPIANEKSINSGRVKIDFHKKDNVTDSSRNVPDHIKKINNNLADELDLFNKAVALYQTNDADEAIGVLDAFIKRFPDAGKLSQAKSMRGHWLLKNNDLAGAKKQFEEIAIQHPDKPEAGEAILRCGYIMILEKQDDSDILKKFLSVARGEIKADDNVRIEAMMRCAALYHKGKDLDTAEAAYKAIEDATKDIELQSFAQMQRAGILLEKAYNGKIPYYQARQICDDLLRRFPKADIQTRSTAALMAIESLSREGNYQEVLKRADRFINDFSETPEAPVGLYWIANAYLETGNPQKASDLLEEVINTKVNVNERFKIMELLENAKKKLDKANKMIGLKK